MMRSEDVEKPDSLISQFTWELVQGDVQNINIWENMKYTEIVLLTK